MKKLNILLATTEALGTVYKATLTDMSKFFAGKQGAFIGEKKTYDPREGTMDDPSQRRNVLVQSTVDEKLDWLRESSKEYFDALMSQEKTNASGVAKAPLIVNGENWGEFSSLELLRLKSIVESNGLYQLMSNIPVRSDAEEWVATDNEMYQDRAIFQSPRQSGIIKTTEKEAYILKDPNVSESSPNYTPTPAMRTTTVELGDYTHQKFSGEWSQRDKAIALRKRTTLLTSIVEALKVANEAEAITSDLTSDKVFGFLFGE